jgi:isopenicillin-N N-acyltransferase like protein
MVLMEPASGLMEVAPLPALNRQFTTYRLDVSGDLRTSIDPPAVARAS